MTQARDPLATTRARARVKELDLLELYLVATEVSRILISNMRCVLQVTTHIKVSHTQNEHMLISYTHNEHDYVLQVKLDPLELDPMELVLVASLDPLELDPLELDPMELVLVASKVST